MPIKPRTNLKEEFQNGDIPDQNDFADTIDSALNLTDDGLVSFKQLTPVGEIKHFGFGGETAPDCPIGIKGEPGQDDKMICFTSFDESQKWNINLNPTSGDVDGFSIDDATGGLSSSRLFIDHVSQGNIGIGTVTPDQKLHVSGANAGANVSMMVENLESGADQGWLMSAISDTSVAERIKTFAIHEKTGSELEERITVLSSQGLPGNTIKNVGINEVLPYATLHVSSPQTNPSTELNLAENTGILLLGPVIGPNLVMDTHQIQGRDGDFVAGSSTLVFTASELALQPYGGGLTINGKSAVLSDQITISSDAKVGIGKTSTEKVTVNGAVVVGDTDTAAPPNGTVRWNSAARDLQVWQNSIWNSLTTHTNTDGLWVDGGNGRIYFNPAGEHPKVGIGVEEPNAMFHVRETTREAFANTGAALINNQAASSAPNPSLTRIGLGITCTGLWNPNPAALNIGLYISNVSGQTAASSNIAAVMNGNTVVGNITGNTLIGESGTNVLAIQNGAAPTTAAGLTETAGIQMYSANITGTAGTAISAFHMMTGDGAIVKLYRQPDMTESDINVPNSGNAITDAIIENLRTRINELEAMMKALGLLAP